MTYTVSAADSEPLHAQLRHVIVENISSGRWSTDTQIPSERELCERYSVSRTTARRTLTDLVHEGKLYTVSGKGTFVSKPRETLEPFTGFSESVRRTLDVGSHTGLQDPDNEDFGRRGDGGGVVSRVLEAEHLEASEDLARHLKVRVFTPVVKLKRLRFWSGRPLSVQTAYLPEHLCPGLLRRDFSNASLFKTLRREYGLTLARGHTVIKAGLASAEERAWLELNSPAAVLRTYQTTFLDTGEVVEYGECVYPGERFELTSAAWQSSVPGGGGPASG